MFAVAETPVLEGTFLSLGDSLSTSLDARMGPITESFAEVGDLARTYRELGERLNTLVAVGGTEGAGIGETLDRINGTLGMAYLFNSVLVLEVSSSPSPLAFQALSALLFRPVLNTRQTTRGTARPWASTALAQQDTPILIEHQLLKDSTPAECGVGASNG